MRVAAVNSFARVFNPHEEAYEQQLSTNPRILQSTAMTTKPENQWPEDADLNFLQVSIYYFICSFIIYFERVILFCEDLSIFNIFSCGTLKLVLKDWSKSSHLK